MRILFVHENFGSQGGAESNLFDTAKAFAERGHVVGLAAGAGTGKKEDAWREVFGEHGHFPLDFARLSEAVRVFQPEAIYLHNLAHVPALEWLADQPIPVTRMAHDHSLYCLRTYLYSPYTRRICDLPTSPRCVFPCLATLKRSRDGGAPFRWLSYSNKLRELAANRRFQRMITASDYVKGRLIRNGFEESRVSVIPYVPRPAPTIEPEFGPRNLLLFLGQILRGKGVDVMLRALTKVRQPFETVILGEGGHKAKCEKISQELGLSDRVHFMGFVHPEEMLGYFREARAVLVPSVWAEPFGLVGIEAMRQGVPVIGFDSGGIREWLFDGQNGFLVPWMDTDAFAERIDRLLADRALARELGQRGRERVARDCVFPRYIDELEAALRRAAGGGSAQ